MGARKKQPPGPLTVHITTVRTEKDPEGACYAVLVGEDPIAFEPNDLRAKGTAKKLQEIIRKARDKGYSDGFDSAAERYDPYGGRKP